MMVFLSKERMKEYQRDWIKRRREAWLALNGPCAACGSSEGLEVDHINPADKVSHRIWSWSEKRRTEELAKCQVLCRPCHNRKTIQDYY